MSRGVNISFEKSKETIWRDVKVLIVPVKIKASLNNLKKDSAKYTLLVKPNDEKTSLPRSAYGLDYNQVTLDKLTPTYTLYLIIKADSLSDRERNISLNFEISKAGKTMAINAVDSNLTMDITVKPYRALNRYNYLAYIGTNFDLVDGIQAKNLFFATSIFAPPPLKGKGFGFHLLLYGNRSLTVTDTSGNVRYATTIVPLPGDSARTYFADATKVRSRVTDNLGASFSPL